MSKRDFVEMTCDRCTYSVTAPSGDACLYRWGVLDARHINGPFKVVAMHLCERCTTDIQKWLKREAEANRKDADTRMREFCGWLSGYLPELHSVDVPRIAEALEAFNAAREGGK